MNELQKTRREMFARFRRIQAERAAGGRLQRASVEILKNKRGLSSDQRKRNMFIHMLDSGLALGRNLFGVEHWRDGRLLSSVSIPNGIVDEGLNDILNVHFDAGTQRATWYGLLIDNTGFTALADDDTYDDIDQAGNGWSEFTSYTDANNGDSASTRPIWPADPASAQSITNSTTKAIYDITASGTVKGIGLVAGTNAATKGNHDAGAAHVLWATALFSGGDVDVENGDQLKVTYTVNAANS